MFGNRLGWIIAAVIAMAMAYAGWRLSQINDLTPLTALGSAAESYERLQLPMEPVAIVAFDRPGDGSALYRSALDILLRDTAAYERFSETGQAKDFEPLTAMKPLIEATAMQASEILLPHASLNVRYEAEPAELAALVLAGHCLGRMALLTSTADAIRARQLYRAEFALGAKLFAERITFYEAFDGIGLMQEALDGMRLLAIKADDKRLADVLTKFNAGMNTFVKQKLEPMAKMFGAVESRLINEHAGDVYAFTGPEMKERLWRIEAILKLGRHKFNVSKLADQVAVPIRLQELKSGETDPAILAAIDAAEKLTLQRYRLLQ